MRQAWKKTFEEYLENLHKSIQNSFEKVELEDKFILFIGRATSVHLGRRFMLKLSQVVEVNKTKCIFY